MTRRPLSVAVLLALVATLLAFAPSASAAPGTTTSWSLSGDGDDRIVGRHTYTYGAADGIRMTGAAAYLEGSVDGWTLDIEAADGTVLEAGRTYTGVARALSGDRSTPTLGLWGRNGACTTVTGSFTIQELTLDADGRLASVTLSFEQHCDGSPGAAYGAVAWHSATPAPALPATRPATTHVTIEAAHRADYGEDLLVTGTLDTDSPVQQVSVYTRVAGGTDQLAAQVPVAATRDWSTRLRLTETTTVTVRYLGTGGYVDATAARTVKVGARLRSEIVGARGHQRRTTVRLSQADPVVGAVLAPDHAGDCVRFRLQLRGYTGWGYDTLTKCLTLDRDSAVAVRVPGDRRLLGIPVRVRPEWKGDERNLKASGRWVFLHFVR